MITKVSILALWLSISPTFAQSNGMDMSMDVPMNLAVGNMLPYLHFTPGDTLWFLGWVPSNVGTMVGACIGLFLLSMWERWLAACLGIAEQHWAERENILISKSSDGITSLSPAGSSTPSSSSPGIEKSKWNLPPLMLEFDITRGILFGAHALFRVFLMLAVMTFQLAFLMSIAIGSGVGEALFGRFSSSHEH